jgi:U3 small nucleolar RNA-associated protein 19
MLYEGRMPGLVNGSDGAAKRKRATSQQKPLKRVRSGSTEEDAQARILLLEDGILNSKKNYNNITVLLRYLQDGKDESVVAAIALCRVFTRILAAGDLVKGQETTENEAVVRLWLRERYSEFKNALLQLLSRTDAGSTALTLCMRMLKSEGTHLQNGLEYNFPKAFLRELVGVLLSPGTEVSIRREFSENYAEEYDDIRFFTFDAVE